MNKKLNFLILTMLIFSLLFLAEDKTTMEYKASQGKNEQFFGNKNTLKKSNEGNFDFIQRVLENKTTELNELGYLPTDWKESLSATYFALYILNATDQLDKINIDKVSNYILSKYDENAIAPFMDLQALRWLDQVDFENGYQLYRYESLLMINAYSVLSLKILGKLDLINKSLMLAFVESCFNPESGASAYMGMPYDASLPANVKTPTLYNTYYAVKLLHLFLEGDFSQYPGLVSSISQFIDALQEKDDSWGSLGGFGPDKERGYGVESNLAWERQHTNAIHNLWAIKTLDLIGMRSVVDLDYLTDYIMNVYRHGGFEWSKTLIGDLNFTRKYADYPATALNLALCKKLGLINEISLDGVLGYLSKGINEYGYFYGTSEYHQYYELVSSFHVLYGLFNAREVFLTAQQTADLVNGLLDHFYNNNTHGFCLLSERYEHVTHLSSLVAGFAASDRISDLDIQQIYDSLSAVYYVFDGQGYFYGLDSIVRGDGSVYPGLRMEPVSVGTDYESSCRLTNVVSSAYGHKYNYLALKTLKKIMKLDDFHANKDLSVIAEYIDRCQIMNDGDLGYGADKVGGFTTYSYRGSDKDDYDRVHFQNAYYALETLNVIINEIGGNYTHYGIDSDKLRNYVNYYRTETSNYIYVVPDYVENMYEDPVITLAHTYYMVRMLNCLEEPITNVQKYTNLVTELLDYDNIENVYYSWKLITALNLTDFAFNLTKTHALVQNSVRQGRTLDFQAGDFAGPNHDILRHIIDMSLGEVQIKKISYDKEIMLGSSNTMNVTLGNLVYEKFPGTITVKFHNDYLGDITLNRDEQGRFIGDINVPLDAKYFPHVEGLITVYNYLQPVSSFPLSFNTTYSLDYESEINCYDNGDVEILGNVSRNSGQGTEPVYGAALRLEVYELDGGTLGGHLDSLTFTNEDLFEATRFSVIYHGEYEQNYAFYIYLDDEFHPEGALLSNFTLTLTAPEQEETANMTTTETDEPRLEGTTPILLSIMAIPGVVLAVSMRSSKKFKAKLNRKT